MHDAYNNNANTQAAPFTLQQYRATYLFISYTWRIINLPLIPIHCYTHCRVRLMTARAIKEIGFRGLRQYDFFLHFSVCAMRFVIGHCFGARNDESLNTMSCRAVVNETTLKTMYYLYRKTCGVSCCMIFIS